MNQIKSPLDTAPIPTPPQVDSAFESLPPELRIQILLQSPDLASLKSLVHASPVYHASYLVLGRGQVLNHFAWRHVDPRLQIDVLAAVRSARHFINHRRNDNESVEAFMDEYAHARQEFLSSNPDRLPKFEWLSCRDNAEVLRVIKLNRAMKLVADDYCHFVATQLPRAKQATNLSVLEHLRLYRSLYRYQTWCNLMGADRGSTSSDKFSPTFPPWEIQEMVCVWQYLMKRWRTVFREVSDVAPDARPSQYPEKTPMETDMEHLRNAQDDSSDDESRVKRAQRHAGFKDRREHLVHRGPVFLASTLAYKSFRERCRFLLVEARYHAWMRGGFDVVQKNLRSRPHLLPPADKYEQPAFVANLTQLPEAEQPSRGWEWFCEEFHIPSLGIGPYWESCLRFHLFDGLNYTRRYFAKRALRWGYPYWDEARLKEWGLIVTQDERQEEVRKRIAQTAAIDEQHMDSLTDLQNLFADP